MEEETELEWTVTEEEQGSRLDVFIIGYCPNYSRTYIKKALMTGAAMVNGKAAKPGHKLKEGDNVEFSIHEMEVVGSESNQEQALKPAQMDLDILFEDDSLLVLNKEAGIVVHPGAGTKEPTLVEGVLGHIQLKDKGVRPGVVHRLDKDTTGVMVFAKTADAHQKLADQFAKKTNMRQYVALLDGIPGQVEESGARSGDLKPDVPFRYRSYLARDERHRLRFKSHSLTKVADSAGAEGELPTVLRIPKFPTFRLAVSKFVLHQSFVNRYSLVTVELETGRTHQIRVHAKHLGAPVLGDQTYGALKTVPADLDSKKAAALKALKRQMLHARKLGFIHPVSGEDLEFEAPVPADFKDVLRMLSQN